MPGKDLPLNDPNRGKHAQRKMIQKRSTISRSSDDTTTDRDVRLEANILAQLQAALKEKDKIVNEQQRRIADLENQKNRIIDEQGRIIKSLSHELTRTKLELIEAPVLGDDELIEGWETLDYKITQLIKRSYDYKAQKTVDPAALENVFRGLSKKYLLGLARHRLYLLKTYIWLCLTFWVFEPKGHIWAGKAHQSFSALCVDLEGYTTTNPDPTSGPLLSLGEYAKWLSRTSTIMETVYKKDTACRLGMRDAAKDLEDNLRPFQKDPNAVSGGLSRDLLELFEVACELDFKMVQAGAHYRLFLFDQSKTLHQQLQQGRFGMRMDASIMEDTTPSSAKETPSPGNPVAMIVSPGIIKTGAGSGSEFGISSVLVKSRVICAESRRKDLNLGS